jgi:hypothetical protein
VFSQARIKAIGKVKSEDKVHKIMKIDGSTFLSDIFSDSG